MIRTTIATLLLSTLVVAGCGKKDGASGSDPKAVEGKVKAPTKLPKVGLSVDVAGDDGEIMVSDGLTPTSNMVNTVPMGGLLVEASDKPQALEDAKSDAAMFTPKDLKTETLSDGYALTYNNKGSMGANFFVVVQRTIDGKTIKCSSTGSDAAHAHVALAACKSLHK
ncbi:hypothetical protein BH11MYX1_BH11MYX1_52790 [soil metagenome]